MNHHVATPSFQSVRRRAPRLSSAFRSRDRLPLRNRLVKAATAEPGDRVLDVACGTSVVARLSGWRVGAAGQVIGLAWTRGC